MMSMVLSCILTSSSVSVVQHPSREFLFQPETRSSLVVLWLELDMTGSSVDPALGSTTLYHDSSSSVGTSLSVDGQEGRIDRVSERQYGFFRDAVHASKGVYSVGDQDSTSGSFIRFEDTSSSSPDRLVQVTQAAVRDVLRLLARVCRASILLVTSFRLLSWIWKLHWQGSKYFATRSFLGSEFVYVESGFSGRL